MLNQQRQAVEANLIIWYRVAVVGRRFSMSLRLRVSATGERRVVWKNR